MDTAAAVPTEGPEQLVAAVQDLQARLDAAPDGPTRAVAEELISALVQLYGAGLEQILDALFEAGEAGERIALGLAEDRLVATLMLIHDLHPVPWLTGCTARSRACAPTWSPMAAMSSCSPWSGGSRASA